MPGIGKFRGGSDLAWGGGRKQGTGKFKGGHVRRGAFKLSRATKSLVMVLRSRTYAYYGLVE